MNNIVIVSEKNKAVAEVVFREINHLEHAIECGKNNLDRLERELSQMTNTKQEYLAKLGELTRTKEQLEASLRKLGAKA